MSILEIPFINFTNVKFIKNKKVIQSIEVEKAISEIEHFQSLLYRTEIGKGMLFEFKSENILSFVNVSFQFNVDVIQFDIKGDITYLGSILQSAYSGNSIQAFQTKYLLMLPFGFIKRNKILFKESKDKSIIKIKVY